MTEQPTDPSSSLRLQRRTQQRQRLAEKAATSRIADVLRDGAVPWKNAVLHDANAGLPLDIATGKPFTPVTTLLLQVASQKNNFVGRWWGDLDGWTQFGSAVGQDCEPTIAYDDEWDTVSYWCIDQVVGEKVDHLRVHDFSIVTDDTANFSRIDRLVNATAADIRVGDGDENNPPTWNGYVPPNPWIAFPQHVVGDYILLRSLDGGSSEFFTLLHELIHWAEVRTEFMCFDMATRELVAEIGSGWLATELACPPCPCPLNHDKWLPSWLEAKKRDVACIAKAADQARKAVEFILSFDA